MSKPGTLAIKARQGQNWQEAQRTAWGHVPFADNNNR